MVEARVPDELRDWNAMDIFIFSNGQKYSPPRKYHLCSDDLKFWASTISFLAHSQYGSLHSKIELYTIEGRKVDGPLELSNDAAYVAVKPPDPFIESGYDRYLLKASRSWEKRLEKRLSGVINPLQEKIHVSGNIDLIAATKSPKEHSVSTTETGKGSKPSSATMNKSSTPPKLTTKSPILSNDRIERRKLLSTKAIFRKRNNTEKLSNSLIKRDSSHIKNLGIVNKSIKKQGLTPSETPIIDAILDTDSSVSSKKVIREKENIVAADEKNNQGLEIIMEKGEIKNENNNVLANKISIPENNNVYKNLDERSNETISLLVDVDKEITKDVKNVPIQEIDHSLCNVHKYDTSPEENSKNNDLTISKKDVATQESYISTNEKLQQTQTKECIFNIHLNIEVKDDRAHSVNNNIALSKRYSLKSVEESKLDMNSNLKDIINEKIDSSKALISDQNYQTSENCDNSKVTVVRCSCSGHRLENDKIFALRCTEKDKDYFILVPRLNKVDSNCRSTMAKGEETSNKTNKCTGGKTDDNHCLITPIKYTALDNTTQGENLKDSKTDNIKEHKVSLENPKLINPSTKSPIEQDIVKNDNEPRIPENTYDKMLVHAPRSESTQTQWCDVLLQARRNPAGDYQFYLPTLKDLKYYKL